MNRKVENTLISVFLLIIIFGGYISGRVMKFTDDLFLSVISDIVTDIKINAISFKGKSVHSKISREENNRKYLQVASKVDGKLNITFSNTVEVIGYVSKTLNIRDIYKDDGIIILKNGYTVNTYPYTSTDYEIQQIIDFKSFLDNRGIHLLYVNEPTKYIQDSYVEQDIGMHTYINNNTDRFLKRLREVGINYLDLRELITNNNSFDWFYRTDHHWTVPAAKIAAEAIAKELNRLYDYNIDISLYDNDLFKFKKYKNSWLGEQGRKVRVSYVGLDDYTSIIPIYKTSFTTFDNNGLIMMGNFEQVLVDTTCYLPDNNRNIYTAHSWHYSYKGGVGRIKNNNTNNNKKILMLGDSFEAVTNTFLALGVSEIQSITLRDFTGNLREYIERNDFDAVIIAYAEFMIGAHDNKSSANYRMFDFH